MTREQLEALRKKYIDAEGDIWLLLEEVQRLQMWEDAVIDALVTDFLLTEEHETNPRKAIQDLIAWNMKLVLDPAVSLEARKLMQTNDEKIKQLQDLIYQVTAAWATRVISFEHNEAMVDFAPAEELDRLLPITDEYIARFEKEGHKLWNL